MSVDLEDYYCDLPKNLWDEFPSRVVQTTDILLDLFEKFDVSATFFALGYIAKRHPELIEKIKARGHELASHGYSHIHMKNFRNELDFESDLINSLDVIRKMSGEKVLGFRAPYFSMNGSHVWAFKTLRKHLKYDSSIFPVQLHYRHGSAPRYIYNMSESQPFQNDDNSSFVEIPLSTLKLVDNFNLPIAGGFYLRFIPFGIVESAIKKINKENQIAVIYIHPKDIDAQMPRIKKYKWHYYWGLKNTTKKLEFLLKNYKFTAVREILNI
jgi:polysaccharide deacetylase family protein (PEP-CTERM system associated)